jgi:hypothetical protein
MFSSKYRNSLFVCMLLSTLENACYFKPILNRTTVSLNFNSILFSLHWKYNYISDRGSFYHLNLSVYLCKCLTGYFATAGTVSFSNNIVNFSKNLHQIFISELLTVLCVFVQHTFHVEHAVKRDQAILPHIARTISRLKLV